MISDKIDLTENRDFRGKPTIVIDINDVRLRESITNDEWEALSKHENIFGRKYHYTEMLDVFSDPESFEQEMREHCQRCGKLLRMPWKVRYDICERCDEILASEFSGKTKFPWPSTKSFISNRIRNDDDSDILSMR